MALEAKVGRTGSLVINSKFDYRKKLNEMIRRNASVKGYRSKLAKAADVQLSYFLAICKGKARLSPDQAFDLCQYWGFNRLQTERFVFQVLLEKSSSPGWQGFLLSRLEEIDAELQSANKKPSASPTPSPKDPMKKTLGA